jgi:hypothetical protein
MAQGSRRPSPALVISFIALLVAISGTASALPGRNQVKKDDIAANAVRSSDIKAKNVRSSDIAPGAVSASDLAPSILNETLTSGSRVTMSKGQPRRTLLNNGTLRLEADCLNNEGQALGRISINTTQPNSAYSAFHNNGSVFHGPNPDDPESPNHLDPRFVGKSSFGPSSPADPEEREIVGVFSGQPEVPFTAMFSAVAPNGASLSGIAMASNIGADCTFVAFGVS